VALARASVVEVLEDTRKSVQSLNARKVLTSGLFGAIGAINNWVAKSIAGIWEREMRRMPWESLLTMAARKYQNHEKLLVYRRLGGLGDRKGTFATTPLKALFVESAPGALWDVYDFDLELKAVRTYLNGVNVERQQNLSLAELKEYVKHNEPAIIHLSGVDGFQGFSLLKVQAKEGADAPAEPGSEAGGSPIPNPRRSWPARSRASTSGMIRAC
jgi:hypothetical protein